MQTVRVPVYLTLLLATACDAPHGASASPVRPEPRSATAEPSAPDFTPPDSAGWGRAGGLRYLEVIKGGASADAELPLVVFIHGLGDRARDIWVGRAERPMRVVMPQAPTPHGPGYAWFSQRVQDRAPAALAAGIRAAADRLATVIELLAKHRPTTGQPIVGGFSQGGMLSYALAAHHPELIHTALPVSGMLPEPLWPEAPSTNARRPPLVALHGAADTVVPVDRARATAAHLSELGYKVDLRVHPDVGHTITAAMQAQLDAALDAAVRALR